MAFVVEDGSGLDTANSYVSVAEFQLHHTDRGTDVSSFTDAQIQAALIKATDYVDKRFGRRFRGFKESKSQGLEWPRISAFDNDDYLFSGLDDVPRQLKRAIFEYGLIAAQIIDLLPIPAPAFAKLDPATGTVSGGESGQVVRKREQVGPLEEETWYADQRRNIAVTRPSVQSGIVSSISLPEYPAADLWLEELLESGNSVTLGRGD